MSRCDEQEADVQIRSFVPAPSLSLLESLIEHTLRRGSLNPQQSVSRLLSGHALQCRRCSGGSSSSRSAARSVGGPVCGGRQWTTCNVGVLVGAVGTLPARDACAGSWTAAAYNHHQEGAGEPCDALRFCLDAHSILEDVGDGIGSMDRFRCTPSLCASCNLLFQYLLYKHTGQHPKSC